MKQFEIIRELRYTWFDFEPGTETTEIIEAPDLAYAIDCAFDLYNTARWRVTGVKELKS